MWEEMSYNKIYITGIEKKKIKETWDKKIYSYGLLENLTMDCCLCMEEEFYQDGIDED